MTDGTVNATYGSRIEPRGVREHGAVVEVDVVVAGMSPAEPFGVRYCQDFVQDQNLLPGAVGVQVLDAGFEVLHLKRGRWTERERVGIQIIAGIRNRGVVVLQVLVALDEDCAGGGHRGELDPTNGRGNDAHGLRLGAEFGKVGELKGGGVGRKTRERRAS